MAKSIPCPTCKFPNFLSAKVCLLCKAELAGAPEAEVEEDELSGGSGAAPKAGQKPLGYLHCHPFEPLPLLANATLRIGRVSDCDLMLPHHSISRCHGVVRIGEGEVHYEDRSSNGSFLNGKRLSGQARLRGGDVLTIGPYDLEVLAEAPSEKEEESAERTSELDFSSFMSGLLEETSIYEVLQSLEFNRKSGSLSLIAGRLRGTLVIVEGQPWHAHLGEHHDEEAVLKMLELKEGRYLFGSTGDDPGQRRIRATLTALLLEGSRQLDELSTQADELSTHLDSDPPTQLF